MLVRLLRELVIGTDFDLGEGDALGHRADGRLLLRDLFSETPDFPLMPLSTLIIKEEKSE